MGKYFLSLWSIKSRSWVKDSSASSLLWKWFQEAVGSWGSETGNGREAMKGVNSPANYHCEQTESQWDFLKNHWNGNLRIILLKAWENRCIYAPTLFSHWSGSIYRVHLYNACWPIFQLQEQHLFLRTFYGVWKLFCPYIGWKCCGISPTILENQASVLWQGDMGRAVTVYY